MVGNAGDQVILEVTGYARGRQLLNKRLARVRVGEDGSYRQAKTESLETALAWLEKRRYELAETVGPPRRMGTATVRYIYRKLEGCDD